MDFLREACDDDFDEFFNLLKNSDSNEEHKGGFKPGWSANIEIDRVNGAIRLHDDSFFEYLTYPDHIFD